MLHVYAIEPRIRSYAHESNITTINGHLLENSHHSLFIHQFPKHRKIEYYAVYSYYLKTQKTPYE